MTERHDARPLPVAQPESDFYWEKARQHELWLRMCVDCDRTYFYPRDICPRCFSRNTTWVRSDGRGVVHTFVIVHRAPTPAFRGAVPYVAAIVELAGGARIPTNLVNVEPRPDKLTVGMSVVVTFADITDQVSLPVFEPEPMAGESR